MMDQATLPLRDLLARGPVAGADDGELLDRFRADRDEIAFAALVARHGPMVWATARGVARDDHDAADAFQATFLILARRANSVRAGSSLAAWLHRVAHRSAVAADRAARSRRRHEMTAARLRTTDPTENDFAANIQAELAHLPATYRLPLILCDLEGSTYAEAAARLDCTEAALRNRLARARARLRTRLGDGVIGAALALPRVSIPADLIRATTTLAVGRVGGSTVVLSLAQTVVRGLTLSLTWPSLAVGLLVATTLGVVGYGNIRTAPPRHMPRAIVPPPRFDPPADPVRVGPQAEPADDGLIHGRVLGPTGQPVAGAAVSAVADATARSAREVAISRADGEFTLRNPVQRRKFEPIPYVPKLVGSAQGFGSGWTRAIAHGSPVVVRLVAGGPPLEGRIVDGAGRPVAGARVQVQRLDAPVDPTTYEEGGTLIQANGVTDRSGAPDRFQTLPGSTSATTDQDGWFHLADLGAERLVSLLVRGPTIQTTRIHTTTGTQAAPISISIRLDDGDRQTRTFQPNRATRIVGTTRAIVGTITDDARPLGGWTIQGSDARAAELIARDVLATSDAAGRYTLTGLPRAPVYRVYLTPPPSQSYLPAGFVQVVAPADDGPVQLDHATHRAVVVQGRVTDRESGAPIAGNILTGAFETNPFVDSFPGYRTSRQVKSPTDEQGRYQAVVPPGPGLVGFTSDGDGYAGDAAVEDVPGYVEPFMSGIAGYYPTVGERMRRSQALVAVDPPVESRDLTNDFQLDPYHTVAIDLVDPAGQPFVTGGFMVDDSTHAYLFFLDRSSRGDSREACHVARRLRKTAPRRVAVWDVKHKLVGSVTIVADRDQRITLRLRPWGEVRGRIVGDDGLPRTDLRIDETRFAQRAVTLFGQRTLLQVARLEGRAITTGPGEFYLIGLEPEVPYHAAVAPVGQMADWPVADLFDAVTVEPGEVKDLGDVVVRRPH